MTNPLHQFTADALRAEAISQGWRTQYNEALWDWLTASGYTQATLNDKIYAAWAGGFDFSTFGFNPLTLFAAGEQGVWYDPSDFSTLYQDSAGTTPVTAVGQSVGLMLDKSRGLTLGAELVTNGGFDSADGWTLTEGASISGGILTMTTSSATDVTATQSFSVEANTFYEIDVRFSETTPVGSALVRVGNVFGSGLWFNQSMVGTTSWRAKFLVTGTTAHVTLYNYSDTPTTVKFDSISLRKLPGNHATQATTASKPTLARHPISGRRNLLTYTEDFSNAAWTVISATKTSGVADPLGGTSAVTVTSTGTNGYLQQQISGDYTTTTCVGKYWLRRRTGTGNVFIYSGATSTDVTAELSSGEWVEVTTTPSVGYGTYTMTRITIVTSGDAVDMWHPQLERGSTPTNYQKVVSTYDVTETGVNDAYHLVFDGVDDSLATSAIDFSATDKMSVFAGYSKLSDAATGVIVELSVDTAANNGSFALFAPLGAVSFTWRSKGTVIADAGTSVNKYLSPTTKVLCGIGDIASDSSILRANGAVEKDTTTDQGTGNYGNYPLYIGRRNNATLPITGNLYSLIVRGALSDATEIDNAETYVNSKTGAY